MMESIDPKTSELFIGKLRSILGDDWCADQLARYSEFRKNYSPTDMWSHRSPRTPPIVPLLFHHEHVKYRGDQPPLGHWYGDPIHRKLHWIPASLLAGGKWLAVRRGEGACLNSAFSCITAAWGLEGQNMPYMT